MHPRPERGIILEMKTDTSTASRFKTSKADKEFERLRQIEYAAKRYVASRVRKVDLMSLSIFEFQQYTQEIDESYLLLSKLV